jgi:hypothetical protein
MAGATVARSKAALRAYTPPASQGWGPLGFSTYRAEASLPGASATGSQDIRHPVGSQEINTVRPGNWQWVQLRQYQSLLSRGYNITTSATFLAEQKVPYLQLATNKTGTGLGLGKLKNMNVNQPGTVSNLLAKATAYGRFQNRIPSSG